MRPDTVGGGAGAGGGEGGFKAVAESIVRGWMRAMPPTIKRQSLHSYYFAWCHVIHLHLHAPALTSKIRRPCAGNYALEYLFSKTPLESFVTAEFCKVRVLSPDSKARLFLFPSAHEIHLCLVFAFLLYHSAPILTILSQPPRASFPSLGGRTCSCMHTSLTPFLPPSVPLSAGGAHHQVRLVRCRRG